MTSGDDKWRKALVDSALDAVIVIDELGVILDFNQAAQTMLGFRREQVLGKNVAVVIIPPKLRASHAAGMERLRKTGVGRILGKRLELPACRSDGSEFQVELVVNQVKQTPPIYIGWIRDISDQKRHEEALRSSEARFRAIADAAPVMIWQGAFDGHILWFNRVWLEFTGMTLDQATGMGWIEAVHPDDLKGILRQYHEALDQRASLSIEYRLRHFDGSYRWVYANMAPCVNESDSLIGYAGSCIDIQSRYEAEQQQRLMQFALDRAGDGVFMVASDSTIQYVNDSGCKMLGYQRGELIGKSVCDFTVGMEIDAWHQHWAELKQQGQFTFETIHERKDSSRYPVEINVNFIEFQGRELNCAFARDISDWQKNKEKLTLAMQAAQSANQAKSEFLAIVSHEMRTPLNSILGLVDLTLDTQLNDDQTGMLNVCRQSGEQLKNLIDDMLDFSQIEQGKFAMESTWFDLSKVMNRLKDGYFDKANEKNLEFRWQVSSDVPKWIGGDSRRLYQIIDNLLSNAIKFTCQGFVAFQARVESTGLDWILLRFTVEDSGVGIRDQDRERIFKKFERVDASATRDQGGVGLGLAICRELAAQMNGELSVEEGDHQGSRFHFVARFPTNENGFATTSSTEEQFFAIANTRFQFPKVTVMLVDDDGPSRMVAKKILEQAGVDVIIAHDGLDAVQIFRRQQNQISAIFMDITMPRLDGVTAQQTIRAEGGKELPIIAMTAQAMKGDRQQFVSSGFDDYISKPISRARVIRALAEALPESMLKISHVQSEQKQPRSLGHVVDFGKLLDHCGQDREHMVAIIECFNQVCLDAIRQIQTALDSRDRSELVSVSHRLRGSVSNMCAREVLDVATEFEQLARAGLVELMIQKWPGFESQLQVLRQELQNHVSVAQE